MVFSSIFLHQLRSFAKKKLAINQVHEDYQAWKDRKLTVDVETKVAGRRAQMAWMAKLDGTESTENQENVLNLARKKHQKLI